MISPSEPPKSAISLTTEAREPRPKDRPKRRRRCCVFPSERIQSTSCEPLQTDPGIDRALALHACKQQIEVSDFGL